MSLRRQMFIRNASRDFLLPGTTLHTLPEEEQPPRSDVPVTDLDATYEPSFDQHEPPATVRVTQEGFQNSVATETNWDESYMDLAQSREDGPGRFPLVLDGPPGTPYTEIEELKPETKKQKAIPPALKLNFATSSRDSIGNLPFSPILTGSHHSLRSIGVDDDPVPALPMSPVAFMSTSTPAPNRDASMDIPLCQSIADSRVFINHPECNMCRICHEDGSKESLISPCHCTGTMGMLHMSCLEKWLGSSKTTKCEICQFKFIVHKKPYSFRWYMSEPALRKDRIIVIKDFLVTLILCLLMLLVNSLTLIFAHRLFTEGKHGPASVLIIIMLGGTFFFVLWMWFVARRFLQKLHTWHERYHTLQIQQTTLQRTKPVRSHTFQKPTLRLPLAFKRQKPKPGDIQPQTLNSSTYISFSLESYQSYKAAMCNPVTPAEEPLLQDTNNNEITSLECHSSSVMSLYEDEEQSSVTYYQPSEPGSTVTYCSETGRLLKETGV